MKNKNIRSVSEYNNELKLKGFNVFQLENDMNATRVYSRKDFYKNLPDNGKKHHSLFRQKFRSGWYYPFFWQSAHPLFLRDDFNKLCRIYLSLF